jgi:hypothetical protein
MTLIDGLYQGDSGSPAENGVRHCCRIVSHARQPQRGSLEWCGPGSQ